MVTSRSIACSDQLFDLVLRERGGVEAEKEERQLWVSRERKKIMDSVNGNILYCYIWHLDTIRLENDSVIELKHCK